MGKRETELTRAIKQTLTGLGIRHFKILQGLGCHPGISDIIAIWPPHLDENVPGRIIAIEVKTPKGKLSQKQEDFLRMVADQKGIALVCRSVDDVIDGLNLRKRFLF